MYNTKELEIIINNCNTKHDLFRVCSIFNYLIYKGDLIKTIQLSIMMHLRYRKLHKL